MSVDVPSPAASGLVVLRGVVGSHAYGLAHAGSDVDRLGVFLAPTRRVLGLQGPSAVSSSYVSTGPDVTLHELGKFASLALRANPTITELLHLDAYEVQDEVGAGLVALRSAFLSTSAVRASYGGYARAQARKVAQRHVQGKEGFSSKVRARTGKHARHCVRLVITGRELLQTGRVRLDVSEFKPLLDEASHLAVSNPHQFASLVEELMVGFERVPSVLAHRADVAAVNDFVVGSRLTRL